MCEQEFLHLSIVNIEFEFLDMKNNLNSLRMTKAY